MGAGFSEVCAFSKATGESQLFKPKKNQSERLEFDLLDAVLLDFPAEVFSLKDLKVLKFPTDHVHKLPQALTKLKELEELVLQTSDWWCKSADDLKKEGVGLMEVPRFVTSLSRLRVLSIYGSPRLKNIFEIPLFQLSNLVELEIVKCGITDLPSTTSSDKFQLSKLNLRGNPLRWIKLSSWLQPTAMRILILSDCNLNETPPDICDMQNLEKLDLSGNKNLHSFSSLACVRLSNLTCLNLSNCDLCGAPPLMNSLRNLNFLNLSYNKNLELFPAAACGGLINLKLLNLSWCNIQTLPNELCRMTSLEKLYLMGNKNLITFPCVTLRSLKLLDVRQCDIQQLPMEIESRQHLEVWDWRSS